ncbi:MAG TPA: hypothetical protein VEQ63_08150 [Bryobacteraceae bacterium]|nr:hypothetical protein [Bryobacteraceae bacterium]
MHLLGVIRPYVTAAEAAAYIALLWRLFRHGLFRTYRLFTVFLCFELFRLCYSGVLDPSTRVYRNLYFFSQPVTWILLLLVIMELYELTLKHYSGLATWGRRVLSVALIASAMVSLATVVLDIQTHPTLDSRVALYFTIERVIVVSLLLFIFALALFLGYFPVPVNRNTILHLRIFSVYFVLKGAVLVALMVIPRESRPVVNLIIHLLSGSCLVAWATLLTKNGEDVQRRSSYRSDPELEQQLVSQLDAINRTLLGSAKR